LGITTSETTATITSSDGDNAVIPVATTILGGVMSKAIFDQHTANVAKSTNVSTALSAGTVNATTYGITSDGGSDDIVLAQATTDVAGVLSAAKWDEIVANTAKVTNVSTNLTATASDAALTVNSSDGDNVSLPVASASAWGVMSDEQAAKLAGIEASATADQTAGEILTLVENGIDSVHYVNVSIDSEHIADEAITEPKLSVTNTPGSGQDNYVLSYNHGAVGGAFTWVENTGSGGTGTVILLSSLEGLNPMSDFNKLFSISFIADLSHGWTMIALASGAEMDAIWLSGVGTP
jgi:hypothetical protein